MGIAACVFYCPPDRNSQEQRELCEYLSITIDSIRMKSPDCGITILGDFNRLDISSILINHGLKQVFSYSTRGNAILDLILTDLHKYYEKPVILAPLGSSDHNSVLWVPASNCKSPGSNKCTKQSAHHFPRSNICNFELWAGLNDWFNDLEPNPSVDGLAKYFTNQITNVLDCFFASENCENAPD